jgi:hypothetical protein
MASHGRRGAMGSARATSTSPLPYRRLSAVAKQVTHLERMREPEMSCPLCETHTTAVDLPRHVECSCPGRREPHPLSRWVPWREAVRQGVPRATLRRWVLEGRVRQRGPERHREYLLRDVSWHLAVRRGARGTWLRSRRAR